MEQYLFAECHKWILYKK